MKILVVDDNVTVRRMIRMELEAGGYEIFEAINGTMALEMIKEIEPHLITMDIYMPDMDGFEVVDIIRKQIEPKLLRGNKRPIIYVSVSDDMELRQKGFAVGGSDFVLKPFLKGELLTLVNNMLQPEARYNGLTVLIAEDSGLVGMILQNIMQSEGLNTIMAVNGEEAYDLYKIHKHDINLVLMDYLMPKMKGDELCRRIRQEPGRKDIPIIILSATSEQQNVLELFKAGASDYVFKPFSKEELLARVKVHLNGELLNRKLMGHVNELKQLNKLKDDFLSITSHDLRSPLNGILGMTELLRLSEGLDKQQQEYLGYVSKSGQFLLELINDILDLGRIQSENHNLETKLIDIDEVIRSSTQMISHMAKPKGIDIKIENRCKMTPLIMGDRQSLNRIFNNLLSNAIKFTQKNGHIKGIIKTDTNNNITVSIQDDGIGISPAVIPTLFDKFSKVSRPGTAGEKSTGLGLPITKELVELHQATIEVSSEEGKGSCFKVSFPSAHISEIIDDEPDHVERKTSIQSRAQKVRILLVDDQPSYILPTIMLLGKSGYNIATALSGKEALELYTGTLQQETQEEMFDLILMDLNMPVMDGFEATTEIRAFEKRYAIRPIPIVALTANVSEDAKMKCRQVGMNGYLTKPFRIDQCDKLIHRFVFVGKD
ncbi:response regulator [bacterium]|nr:response regulator [bacterium]